MIKYYTGFAKGGFAMIITEGTYTDDQFSKSDPNQPGIVNEAQLAGWEKVVAGVHKYDSLIICQLMHAGALGQHSDLTIAPSAIQPLGARSTEPGGLTGAYPLPKEITVTDMAEIKKGFVNAAKFAEKAGFDGVELHAANGYLFDQFLTAHTNTRDDQYGGNMYNRLRFLIEVFVAVKAAVSAAFIIGIRLSESKVNDLAYRWPEGSAMAIEIFNILKETGAGYLHLAAEGGKWARECLYADGQSSGSIAKRLTGLPVIANGGLHNVTLAESLIQDGHADLISIGRAAIANPDWPNIIAADEQPVPFQKEFIKPSLTLQHTMNALIKYKQKDSACSNV
jgi:2,4-dienoyl-CoA reductase-like NADH-dependent reductase (Old Yellow Enzyme family)